MSSPYSNTYFKEKSCYLISVLLLLIIQSGAYAGNVEDPINHPKFVNPLPAPSVIDAKNGGKFDIEMRQSTQWLGLVDSSGNHILTQIWGYGLPGRGVTYPGPTFEAMENVPINVKWKNQLPPTHLLPIDTTLHLANPARKGIPTVTHLHGGHTESASDGLPEAWFTQGHREVGPSFVKKTYSYDNDQEAATLWYHDHALGLTRLNVYAGLAGFYLLRDQNELNLVQNNVLPSGIYEREIVIQDRRFTNAGELTLPSTSPELECPLPDPVDSACDPTPNPSIIAEFFGDYILVNGITWPQLSVEPRKYRLRLLNGSDSRFYILELRNNANVKKEFLQIGTDDGLLENPVPLTQLVIAPGERADLVVDFAEVGTVTLKNYGPDEPFKGCTQAPPADCIPSDGEGGVLSSADSNSTGLIMKFNVAGSPPAQDVTVASGTQLRAAIMPLTPTENEPRQLALFEGLDNYGRLQPMLGTIADGSLAWFQQITENPSLDSIEEWEIYNVTADAHPIHLHMVSFQVVNRQDMVCQPGESIVVSEKLQPQHDGATGVGATLQLCDSPLIGMTYLPPDNEKGWKDTVQALPGQVVRVRAKFDRPGRYVWHCHILSHEDHEMMRPLCVGDLTEENCGPLGQQIN